MKVEVGMMKDNDFDRYASRLNEIMENSPPKIRHDSKRDIMPEDTTDKEDSLLHLIEFWIIGGKNTFT